MARVWFLTEARDRFGCVRKRPLRMQRCTKPTIPFKGEKGASATARR